MAKIKKWRIVGSEYLIRRPWLTARKDKVELPDGRVNDEYYVLEYPTWVNVLAIVDDGLYVMAEQTRHGLGDVYTELCAGVAESGETPIEAARRELLEETGFGGGKWRLLNIISQNPATCTNLTYCFLAEGVSRIGAQRLDATEDINVRLLTDAEVLSMLKHDKIKQALMATPLWHHFAEKML